MWPWVEQQEKNHNCMQSFISFFLKFFLNEEVMNIELQYFSIEVKMLSQYLSRKQRTTFTILAPWTVKESGLTWKMSEAVLLTSKLLYNYRVLQDLSKVLSLSSTYPKDFLATLFTIRCQVFAIAIFTV